jgi:hypothetical protein
MPSFPKCLIIDLPQSNSAPDPRHVDSHNDATLRRLKLSDNHSKIRSTALSQVSQIPEFLLNSSPRFWTIMPYPVPDHIPQVSFLKDSSMTPHSILIHPITPQTAPSYIPTASSNLLSPSPIFGILLHISPRFLETSCHFPSPSSRIQQCYPDSRTLSPNPAAKRHMTT